MRKLFTSLSQIVTVSTQGRNIKKGHDAGDVGILENHSIVVENGKIADFIPSGSVVLSDYDEVIGLKDKVLLPGLIDCHTHTVFAGSRCDEFKMKIAGVDYEDIARQGGGISKTMGAVRSMSEAELLEVSRPRINYFISQGITSLEIKSGYGLSFEDEIKILMVISQLNREYPIDIIPTFLGAHTYPPEYKQDHKGYLDLICNKMLPYVAENKLALFCDAFCETTAFQPDETELVLEKAASLGFMLKLHTEQFNRIGGLDLGLKYKVRSLDHLEVISPEDMKKAAASDAVCVLLPGVSFFLHYGYAPAMELIKNGAAVALSTDYNPGSSHIANLNLIMSLAAVEMRMTVEEIISAVTINAAAALFLNGRCGSLEIGKNADFAVFDTENYADIVYNVGKNLNICTIKNGEIIYKSN